MAFLAFTMFPLFQKRGREREREIKTEERTERWTDKSEMNVRSVALCAVLQLNHQKAV